NILYGKGNLRAIQDVGTYEFEKDIKGISVAFGKLVCLQIAYLLIRGFLKGDKPLTASRISEVLKTPIRLVRQILYMLVESGIASEIITEEPKETAYQPARDINTLTIGYIIEAIDKKGSDNIPIARSRELNALSDALEAFNDIIRNCPANKLLKDI
ncbi:MAG: YihY/virulence factor BrkB family protein, partial [Thermodesulfobacteriota bacterium]|nr:YihY/virulence factor BrkB family protein [Thermodesulfobacteriota bacterium]